MGAWCQWRIQGGALGAEAPPFQSPSAFKCTDAMLRFCIAKK